MMKNIFEECFMVTNKFKIIFSIVFFGIVASFFILRFPQKGLFPFSYFTFDSYVHKVMHDWHVPGLALAVIKGDDIAYMKCYGVLEEGRDELVNENTLFAIGSCSKAFTAAALGILVDEKKLQWDDKAHTFLKDLQLPDEYMTRELTIRDMLSHRSGLEEAGMLWAYTGMSRKELMSKIRYLKPKIDFRTEWLYNNLIFLSAGEIIPVVAGISWDDFIIQRIFKPLHMTRSNTSARVSVDLDNVASPHCVIDNKAHPIPYHIIDAIAPAGAINSTISDMSHWVKLHVNRGIYNDARIISEDTINEMSCPQSIVDKTHPFHLYGLGLALYDYHGEKVIFHEGNIDGMSATFAILPEKKIGLIVLANINKGFIGKILLNTIFDKYLGIKPSIDWNAKLLADAQQKKAAELADEEKRNAERIHDTTPSLDLGSYVGTYRSLLYGDAIVSKTESGLLNIKFLAYRGVLEHWQKNTFVLDIASDYPLFTDKFTCIFTVDNKKVTELQIQYPSTMDGLFKKIQ